MTEQVLAEVGASPLRRIFAVGAVGLLGVLLVYLAVDMPEGSAVARAALVVAGLLALLGAWRQWQATALTLVLTPEVLRDSDGTVLARVADIAVVDRGSFAFKPTNGFVLLTATAQPKGWAPGLWWRIGRRVGIGGVCRAADTKAMAEMLSVQVAQRKEGGA